MSDDEVEEEGGSEDDVKPAKSTPKRKAAAKIEPDNDEDMSDEESEEEIKPSKTTPRQKAAAAAKAAKEGSAKSVKGETEAGETDSSPVKKVRVGKLKRLQHTLTTYTFRPASRMPRAGADTLPKRRKSGAAK